MAEVSEQLGKSLLKFCSGDLGPESILPDAQLLDPMLAEAPTTPLALSLIHTLDMNKPTHLAAW